MAEPLVSVIMPVFNAGKYLEESILSVLGQTYSNWELWMVDDHSTDGSGKIIQNYCLKDERIKSITLDNNSGSAIARNKAIERAAGKYIAFLDADDLWKPDKLKKQVSFMENNGYAFSYTFYEWVDENGKPKNQVIWAPLKVNYKQLLKNNVIGCLTAMYCVERIGKQFMPDIRKRQDYGLWLDILKKGNIAYCLPENLASYRISSASLSNNKLNVLKYNWELLRKYQGLSRMKSAYYFSCFLFNKSIKYFRH